MAHKKNLKKRTRIDLNNQNNTIGKLRFKKRDLKYLCWVGYFEFSFENLETNDSMSHQKHAPNNCDKFFKIPVQLPSILAQYAHFFCKIYHFFSILSFQLILFFLFF